ncbi:hypothetical protein AN960_12845 [Bacillus sp. FJAT-25509]|nr:hypothetical protein AN960_12845 [Bacillus sp. FJAT-25509]
MFKNKEDRMWVYLAVPTFIIGIIIIYYSELNYYQWILFQAFLAIFYIWRFFYRRKRKKEEKKSY